MIRDAFQHIAENYLQARREPFTGHPLANFIRQDAAVSVRKDLGAPDLEVRSAAGQGQWAHVPWIVTMNPAITTSAMRGYYFVYLFSADMERLYLTLNQGTTAVLEEFGGGALEELRRRASLMRARLPEYQSDFDSAPIDLASKNQLPRGYEAGHVFGRSYDLKSLPPDPELIEDLHKMLEAYRTLWARGGIDTLSDENSEDQNAASETIEEKRRYRFHRKIERNSKIGKLVKQAKGYTCEGCGFDFEKIYGDFGRGYIEAHHLVPLSDLPEEQSVSQDPKKDFAVLCANCHRMVHRSKPVMPIDELRALNGVSLLRDALEALED